MRKPKENTHLAVTDDEGTLREEVVKAILEAKKAPASRFKSHAQVLKELGLDEN